jgi:hypothetical protein
MKGAEYMAFPKSRQEMLDRGWTNLGAKICAGRGCGARIEMWQHPETKNSVPMNAEGEFISHFATCPRAIDFSKSKTQQRGFAF